MSYRNTFFFSKRYLQISYLANEDENKEIRKKKLIVYYIFVGVFIS